MQVVQASYLVAVLNWSREVGAARRRPPGGPVAGGGGRGRGGCLRQVLQL